MPAHQDDMQAENFATRATICHADSPTTPHELRLERKPCLDYPFGQRRVAIVRPTSLNKGTDLGILATYLGGEEGSNHLRKVQILQRTKG